MNEIYHWLDSPDPSSNLLRASDKRHHNTGNWLLGSSSFNQWQSDDCSFLWLYGKAGSGKTILSSTAIRSLAKEDVALTYFYFDFQSREKQLFRGLLSSMMVQISKWIPKASGVLRDLYKDKFSGQMPPEVQELKSTLHQMIEDSKPRSVYIVIDALDECQERRDLLKFLKEIRDWNQGHVHLFATSRNEADLFDALDPVITQRISLEESVAAQDIIAYIQDHLQSDIRLSRWPEDVRKEIGTALLKGANGMFRWVVCQLDDLRMCIKLGSLRQTLVSLPKTLNETYARILKSIRDDWHSDVHRILSLVIYSYHPLTLEEIATTIPVLTEGEEFYDPSNIVPEARDILVVCSSLVSVNQTYRPWGPSDGPYSTSIEELRLDHFSIQEYLTSKDVEEEKPAIFAFEERKTHEYITLLCVRVILWCTQPAWQQVHSDKFPFAMYAASFWSYHFKAANLNPSSPLYEQCIKMLFEPRILAAIMRLRRHWFGGRCDELRNDHNVTVQCSSSTGSSVNQDREMGKILTGDLSPLFYVSLLGLDNLLMTFLENGENTNSYGPQGTSLSGAAYAGHLSTVRLLINCGANVNARIRQTLCTSTDDPVHGDTVMVDESIANDTAPDVSSDESIDGASILDDSSTNDYYYSTMIGYSRTAIHSAVEAGLEEIVKILLDNGADVNLSRSYLRDSGNFVDHNTPLQAATYSNNHSLVRLLLSAGADPNAHRGDFITVLETVSEIPAQTDLATVLLDGGADPNIYSDSALPKPPLYRAIVHGNRSCAELLISRGADPALIDSRIVKDIISKIYEYSAPGVRPGDFSQAVKMMVHLRLDINLEGLLLPATKYGYIDIVRLLLQSGVSPNTQDSDRVAALHAAAFASSHDLEMVKLLLDAGSDINLHGGPFGSALQAASLKGQVDVIRLLLERGASVNYAIGMWGSALNIAQDRLEDQKKGRPIDYIGGELEAWPGYLSDYLPEAWITNIPSKYSPLEENVLIDIGHHANADYQAVIDILIAHGALASSEIFADEYS